jgi:hypothetical protein
LLLFYPTVITATAPAWKRRPLVVSYSFAAIFYFIAFLFLKKEKDKRKKKKIK